MEMIDVGKIGSIAKFKEELINKGREKGKREAIKNILIDWVEHGGTISDFSKRTGRSETELNRIYHS